MRRRIGIVVSAVLAATTITMLGPNRPASATSVCVVVLGTVNLSQGLVYPLTDTTVGTVVGVPLTTTVTIHGSRTADFAFSFGQLNQCIPGGNASASGTLHGWCGHSAGQGTTDDGFRFGYTSAGSILVVTGGLVGVANAIPNPLITGNSCIGTGASQFLVTGVVAKVHCSLANVLSFGLTTIVPGDQKRLLDILPIILTVHSLHVANDPIEAHHHVHVCTGLL